MTQAGAIDNTMSLDFSAGETEADVSVRRFSTQMRTHETVQIMLNYGAGGITFAGYPWEYENTEKQNQYIVAIYELTRDNPDKPATSKAIAAKLNKPASTVTNAIQALIKRGHVDSVMGNGGGYLLTPRALMVVGKKY